MFESAVGPAVSSPRSGRVASVVLAVGALFTGEALFQTLLPVSMQASGVESGVLVGAVLAISQGIGITAAPPVAAWSDARGRRIPLLVGGLSVTVAMLALVLAAGRPSLLFWIVPVLAYGLVRVCMITMTLAVVSTTGDPVRMQGFNGAAQRGSAVLAAVAASALIAGSHWKLSFVCMAIAGLSVALLARRITTGAGVPDGPIVPWGQSYRASFAMLRAESALRASSLLNAGLVSMILLGSAFYPLTLDVGPVDLGRWVLIMLVARDLTAVIVGPQFHRMSRMLGFYPVLLLMAGLMVGGLALMAFASTTWYLVLPAASMQGVAAAFGIGITNLLATAGGQPGGRGLRLVSTNYLNSLAALLLPVLFGTLADMAGGRGVFLVGAGIAMLLMMGVLSAARGWQPAL